MKSVPPPHPAPRAPAYALPPGSCDSHVHVYGPAARFPYAPERRYDPPDAPIETLQRLHRHLGVERAVLVQATVHGTDNRAMLDAIARDPQRYRGVALVGDDTGLPELQSLHEQACAACAITSCRTWGLRPTWMPSCAWRGASPGWAGISSCMPTPKTWPACRISCARCRYPM